MVLFLWPRIVGEKIARNARAERVRGKTLFVATRTSSWTTELTFLKAEIMRKIRGEVGGRFLPPLGDRMAVLVIGTLWNRRSAARGIRTQLPGEKNHLMTSFPDPESPAASLFHRALGVFFP